MKATKSGEELGFPMYDENYNQITRNDEEKAQKGQTLEVAIALTLVNTTEEVVIVFSDFDNHESLDCLTKKTHPLLKVS